MPAKLRNLFGSNKKYLLLGIFVPAVFTISAASVVFINNTFFRKLARNEFIPNQNVASQQEMIPIDQDEKDSISILLLGYGGAGHDGGMLTDVIKLIHISHKQQKIAVVSIPRDLWVSVPVRSDISEHYKINHAYAIGSDDKLYPLKQPQYKGESGAANMTKEVVAKVTGIAVDNVLAIDFTGLEQTVDLLGGVSVDVPVAFDDYFYPVKGRENELCGKSPEEMKRVHELYSGFELEKQFECRYEHLHFDAGTTEMNGETALKFVRSRHSSQHGGDFARAQRQMALLYGIKDKALSLGALDDLPKFVELYGKHVKHDVDINSALALVKKYPQVRDYEIVAIDLSTTNVLAESRSSNGQFILIPKGGVDKWEGVHSFIEKGE